MKGPGRGAVGRECLGQTDGSMDRVSAGYNDGSVSPNLSVRPAFSIRRMSRQTSCALAHHLCLMAGKVETRLTFGGLVS